MAMIALLLVVAGLFEAGFCSDAIVAWGYGGWKNPMTPYQHIKVINETTGQPGHIYHGVSDGNNFMALNADPDSTGLLWAIVCQGAQGSGYWSLVAYNMSHGAKVVYENREIVADFAKPADMDGACTTEDMYPMMALNRQPNSTCSIATTVTGENDDAMFRYSIFRLCPDKNSTEHLNATGYTTDYNLFLCNVA
eukprot:TRINITY_DN9593_c0_g1_i2.p1 TRINITY_DN9593_c0_g1~~TRINITY_DN9593_c0_g1_i2.p1  ORF type:complete len:194 (+),score=32.38 TRINITY_DN9593_c0_g1_i2:84-665(+)